MKNKPASITVCAFSQSDKIELAPPEVVGRDLEWIFGAMMHCMTVGDGRKWVKRPEGLEENLCSFLPELKRDFNGANNDDRSSSLWSSELRHKIPKVNLLLAAVLLILYCLFMFCYASLDYLAWKTNDWSYYYVQ